MRVISLHDQHTSYSLDVDIISRCVMSFYVSKYKRTCLLPTYPLITHLCAGILIVVAVGVALGVLLGGLLLIFVVVYMRR